VNAWTTVVDTIYDLLEPNVQTLSKLAHQMVVAWQRDGVARHPATITIVEDVKFANASSFVVLCPEHAVKNIALEVASLVDALLILVSDAVPD